MTPERGLPVDTGARLAFVAPRVGEDVRDEGRAVRSADRHDLAAAGAVVAVGKLDPAIPPEIDPARWTEQHDGEEWPTAVRPVLERTTPMLFEAAMTRIGVELTASRSDHGMEFRLAPRPA